MPEKLPTFLGGGGGGGLEMMNYTIVLGAFWEGLGVRMRGVTHDI